MKDYKSFISEAAGEGFGKNVETYKRGSKLLKKIQKDNKRDAVNQAKNDAKSNEPKKKPAGYAFSPDGAGRKGASGRRYERERIRDAKIDDIKHERGQRLKQGVGAVRNAIVGKGSGSVGTTGGGDSSDRSVRYQ